ncbi:MAG: hypothetical protein IPL83_01455 [Bdellovibrionales bacterium]|nr:hypothetical protein [Bdellovibrionales bacterium]
MTMLKGSLRTFKLTVLTVLLVISGLSITASYAQAASAAVSNKCAELFLTVSDRQAKVEGELAAVETQRLGRAEEYLGGIVKSGKFFTFDQVVEYVILSLLVGKVKDDFVDSLQKNVVDQNLTISEREGLRALFRSSRVAYYSRLLHPLRDQAQLAKKIYWNARVVRTSNEAVTQAFEAIRVVLEPEFKPIRSVGVYFNSRGSYVREFLESAQKLFSLQYEVYQSTKTFADISIPTQSAARIAFGKTKRIFSNLLWLKQYRTIRDLKLSQDVVDAIDTQDPLAVKALVRKKYGAEILVHWYVRHLRNIQNAAIVALAAVLVPPLTNAVGHQYYLETLQTSQMEATSVRSAVEIVSGANNETLGLLRQSVENAPRNGVQPSETQFFSEIGDILANDAQNSPP